MIKLGDKVRVKSTDRVEKFVEEGETGIAIGFFPDDHGFIFKSDNPSYKDGVWALSLENVEFISSNDGSEVPSLEDNMSGVELQYFLYLGGKRSSAELSLIKDSSLEIETEEIENLETDN